MVIQVNWSSNSPLLAVGGFVGWKMKMGWIWGLRFALVLTLTDSSLPAPPLVAPFFPVEKMIAPSRLWLITWFAAPPQELPVTGPRPVSEKVLQTRRPSGWHVIPYWLRYVLLVNIVV